MTRGRRCAVGGVGWLDTADVNLDGDADFFVVLVVDNPVIAAEVTKYACWNPHGSGGFPFPGNCGTLAAQVEGYPMKGKVVASDVDGDGLADALFSATVQRLPGGGERGHELGRRSTRDGAVRVAGFAGLSRARCAVSSVRCSSR